MIESVHGAGYMVDKSASSGDVESHNGLADLPKPRKRSRAAGTNEHSLERARSLALFGLSLGQSSFVVVPVCLLPHPCCITQLEHDPGPLQRRSGSSFASRLPSRASIARSSHHHISSFFYALCHATSTISVSYPQDDQLPTIARICARVVVLPAQRIRLGLERPPSPAHDFYLAHLTTPVRGLSLAPHRCDGERFQLRVFLVNIFVCHPMRTPRRNRIYP